MSEQSRSINCVICYNDVTKYVVLDCLHFIGLECFLNMIRHSQYKCPICRQIFHIENDDDDAAILDVNNRIDIIEDNIVEYDNHDEQITDMRTRINQIENCPPIINRILDSNYDNNILLLIFSTFIIFISSIPTW